MSECPNSVAVDDSPGNAEQEAKRSNRISHGNLTAVLVQGPNGGITLDLREHG